MRRLAPLALLLLAGSARAEWMSDSTNLLTNQLSIAVALRAHDVDPTTARALIARTGEGAVVRRYDRLHARERLELTEATTVALMTLDAFATPSEEQAWSFESGEICTRYAGATAPATHARLTAMSPMDTSGTDHGAQVFRSPEGGGEQVLTWLRPGESVTMVEAVGQGGQAQVERIELTQRDRLLTLERDDTGTEACYLDR